MDFILTLLIKFLVFSDIDFDVKKGTKRITFVFYQYDFAIKFAKFDLSGFLTLLRLSIRQYNRYYILLMTRGSSVNMCFPGNIEGFLENWREYVFYLKHRDKPFLFPIYFSFFRIFNIMPIKDDLPISIRVDILFKKETTKNEDSHHFKNCENFCFYRGHLSICDYGSILTQEIIVEYDFFPQLTESYVRAVFTQ